MTRLVSPSSLEAACQALAQPGARALAGGTDLMLELRRAQLRGEEPPALLVDLTRVAELGRVEPQAREPFLGAGVTFRRLEDEPALVPGLPLLGRAAATVGSRQVRTTATLGGNAANASPAADGVSALVALEARAHLLSLRGRRELPLAGLITGPYQTALAPGELIAGFSLRPPAGRTGCCFLKVGRRQAVSVARLNLAVVLDAELADPRLVLGACFPTPHRLGAVEELLRGGRPGPELWREAGQAAAEVFRRLSGGRASAAYKLPAIARCTARALAAAWAELEER